MEWIIYAHKNLLNGKMYIGQTHRTLEERSQPNGTGYKKCPLFWKAIQKYGWDNFEHIILAKVNTQEEANEKEKQCIKIYKTNQPAYGYNLTEGGESGPQQLTEDTKEKIRRAMTGEKNPFYGKHHTEETKQKIREHLPDYNNNNNPFYGKHHTEETKQKISQKNKGKHVKSVLCVTTGEVFSSIQEASKKYNVDPTTISAVCHHSKNRKSAGKHPITKEKLVWRFVNEEQ